MPTAEATIQTGQPSRYLIQLCRHASLINHKILQHHASKGQARPDVQHVEWSDAHGTLAFSWGRCTLQAGPDMLTLRAEAADQDSLQRIQDLVAANLERFGRRDRLKVIWQRPEEPAARPGDVG